MLSSILNRCPTQSFHLMLNFPLTNGESKKEYFSLWPLCLQSNGESMIDKNGNVWTCIVCGKIAADAKTKVSPSLSSLFYCAVCYFLWVISSSRRFFLQANLKRHTETHIKGIPWPCNICGKVSGSKSGLAQHKAKYHKDQESAMVVKVGLPILLLDSKFSFSATNGPEHPGRLHDQLFDWEARRCMGLHKVQQ